MRSETKAQAIVGFAILFVLIVLIALILSRKQIKPALERMYREAIDKIENSSHQIIKDE